jgi:hypothetical protein
VVWSFDDGSYSLRYGKRTAAILHVVADKTYAGMWRIRFPDGALSDMANLTRAKDAALDHAQRITRDTKRHRIQRPQELRDSPSRGGSHHPANEPANDSSLLTVISSAA